MLILIILFIMLMPFLVYVIQQWGPVFLALIAGFLYLVFKEKGRRDIWNDPDKW